MFKADIITEAEALVEMYTFAELNQERERYYIVKRSEIMPSVSALLEEQIQILSTAIQLSIIRKYMGRPAGAKTPPTPYDRPQDKLKDLQIFANSEDRR